MGSFAPKELLAVALSIGWRCVWQMASYAIRQRLTGGRQSPGHASRVARPLGNLLSIQVSPQAAELYCENGVLRLEALADDLVRFRLRPGHVQDFRPLFSYALDPEAQWPPAQADVQEGNEAVVLRTRRLTCRVQRSPCRLSFFDAEGQPLSEGAEALSLGQQGGTCAWRLEPDEALYGLAEKAVGLNLRGHAFEMWNRDPSCYMPGHDPIYANIPFLITLRAGRACAFFFDNPGRARFDLGKTQRDRWLYQVESGEVCGYFFAGPKLSGVLERYTQLTGRIPLPPRWLLGYQQSRWSYQHEQEVRELATEFRRRRIPCDVLYLDIHYMDGYRVFTWDARRFPDPPRLLADLRQQGFRVITSMDTGVKVEPGYGVHDEGLARDAFCRLTNGKLFRGPVWPGECYFPDFTHPEVRAWWGSLHRNLLDAGVAGVWNDMNEPTVFGGEMSPRVVHRCEGQPTLHDELHNAYGLQMVRACAEGVRRLRPAERVPIISRAGYAGIQRYALLWTGDNRSTWEHLRLGVSMCLNLGLSGVALCGPDVGGFSGDCSGELLARWTQVGAFTPFFRNHSALGSSRQEPWRFGEPYESICRRAIELRYELLPYLYTAAWQAAQTGLPIMRPLVLAFPEDPRTYGLDDQFLVGDSLLVAPVLHPGQTARRVYLPGGTWYDFWTGAPHTGEIWAEAPLERIPLYVRAGTALPAGPVLQHSDEWPPEALKLSVYPGDGESWLYEDDGRSLAYQAGHFRRTRFVCAASPERLTVERHTQGPFDPGYSWFEIRLCGLAKPCRQVQVDGQAVEVTPDAQAGTLALRTGAWRYLEAAFG